MNGKQLGLLFGLLVLIGGAGLLVEHGRNQAGESPASGAGGTLLGANFPINDVMRISIKGETNGVTLEKKSDTDVWRVGERNDYPANFTQISAFFVKARDLKIVESDAVTAADLKQLELLPPGQGTNSGMVITFMDKDGKTLKSVTLGKMHMRKAPKSASGDSEDFADGRYLTTGGDTQTALLVPDPLTELDSNPSSWLNKDFFKVERAKAIAVSFPGADGATNSWKITRDEETGAWKLTDPAPGEQPDTNKMADMANPFADPTFDDVLTTGNKPEETGLDKPTVLTVDTFDDLTYTIKLGTKVGDTYKLTMAVAEHFPKERNPLPGEKPEDKDKADKAWQDRQKVLQQKFKDTQAYANWVYVVPSWEVEMVVKDRKDLMAEKKDEPKPADQASDSTLTNLAPAMVETNAVPAGTNSAN